MNQADISKLVSKLKINIKPRHRNLKNPEGPEGRLDKLRKTVTGLIKHERIELNYNRADEARGYTERLISEAIRYGDRHKPTMEMANYWLEEKQLIHKLFKVLVPRFENYTVSYTRMFKAPSSYPNACLPRAVLELRGNPFPPLNNNWSNNKNLLHNVLLDAARRDFRKEQYEKLSQSLTDEQNAKQNPTS
ncbi:mitochondrial ribosomal protein L17 [Rhodnius prolixus]|uniref:Large ribosomal subunit protein bL17m n=2 Tax=Rhodnius TaxID=13248 RepID=R4G3U1_RHOPR